MAETDCIKFINDIVSKYARTAQGGEEGENSGLSPEEETAFWEWLCPQLEDRALLECLKNSERKDYYGVIDTVKEGYAEKCKPAK